MSNSSDEEEIKDNKDDLEQAIRFADCFIRSHHWSPLTKDMREYKQRLLDRLKLLDQ